jgi:hypothetical protein
VKDRPTISEEEFARRTAPTVRLFLSVDLENSTKLKHATPVGSEDWLRTVLQFVRDFPQLFESQLVEGATAAGHSPLPVPPVWKMLGDELIFVTSIHTRYEAQGYVEAFRHTLDSWNRGVRLNGDRGSLRVKGAAWIAGFPIVNAMFNPGGGREDFAGPSIDAGFRVTKLATPRRLAISVELAWILLKAKFAETIHFDGPAMLKGIAEESGYPSLWIEVGLSNYTEVECRMLGRGDQEKRSEMLELCRCFILEFGVPKHLPFLTEDPKLAKKPKGYDKQLQLKIEFMRRQVYLVDEPSMTMESDGTNLEPERQALLQDLEAQEEATES